MLGGEQCMQEDIFVLDIGTRSVIALLARLEKGDLSVSHMLFKEHKSRAMLDGQIHHVDQVTEVIDELVQEMKRISGQDIKKVAAAAAGRALTTVKGIARTKYTSGAVISREELMSLELLAVQEAQLALPKQHSDKIPLSQQYYCVGYSVVRECLDGIRLGTILGQKGQDAEVEVVATFLPRIVVESLQVAVQQAGLELCSITLEPIAVANLVLSQSMRRLNLVLVDVGAGTADIAVCGGDSISAFGMVPMAGDEITETISDHYLLDFIKAEEVKRQLETCEKVQTVDVLGIEQYLQSSEVKSIIEPTVEGLAAAIAKEILVLNNKPPQAVLLVGGGSLTPSLPQTLAGMLEVPENRIVVQQAGKLQQVHNLLDEFQGPSFITVLGIAYTFLTSPTMGFITVNINGEAVKLLQLAQNTVAEALIAGGHSLRDIYGRPGLAITCEINDQLYTLPGKSGKPGHIILNGKEAEFGEKVNDNDIIEFLPGVAGEDGQGTFGDILKDSEFTCIVNNKKVTINPLIMLGDEHLSLHDQIKDGSKIKVCTNQTIQDILAKADIHESQEKIWINQREILLQDLATIKKNGHKATVEEMVNAGDRIKFELPDLTVGDILPDEVSHTFEVFVNGKRVVLRSNQIWVNDEPADFETLVKSGDKIEYVLAQRAFRPILIDVFKEIEFSSQPPIGKSKLLLMVNNEEKEYTYELQRGDKIQFTWI
jgi:cell division protein FtsA